MELKEEPTVEIEMKTLDIVHEEDLNSAPLSEELDVRTARCWRCQDGT